MALFLRSVKLGSLVLWPSVLTLAAGVVGCIIVEDDHNDDCWDDNCGVVQPPPEQPPADEPMTVNIDPDATFTEVAPGEGVGLFMEYGTGGKWHLWTTCDTNYSNVACSFDVVVSVDTESEVLKVDEEDLEGFDEVRMIDSGTASFKADTASDTDGMVFETTPGATVRLDMLLDGKAEPRFVFWFGDGVLHKGAPTNPVDFAPKSP